MRKEFKRFAAWKETGWLRGWVRKTDELEETGEFEETVELSLILRHRDENGT
jgi:hypothetical protein